MQDKTTIIEKIACGPQRLTDAEIKSISQDADLQELYEGASMLSQALADVPDFDVEKSLLALHGKMLNAEAPAPSRGFLHKMPASKAAAAFVGIALTGLAAIAAVYFAAQHDNAETAEAIEAVVDNEEEETAIPAAKLEKLYYDDAPLSQILDDLCQRYHCKVNYKNADLQNSRFHLTIPAEASLEDAIDMLNAFDDVKISLQGDMLIVE